MDKSVLKRAKKYVFELLGYNGRVTLHILSKDSCSEVSRLLGEWLHEKLPRAKIYIAKGKIKKHFHEIVLVQNKKVYALDPTVWQFFKNKKSILVAEENSLKNVPSSLTRYYGGTWHISENVKGYSASEIKKFKEAIIKNKTLQ
jgi:hypothetical protein